MSMLAERRRKTKWVINPTKKPLWATDSNGIKYGKELMEKMGWSAGKGLGAKEQGIHEPLRVSYKNDTKGMGFKGNDDDWIEQQDEFNVLLNQLRNSDDSAVVKVSEEEKNGIKSLEEKSKQSRARVHYQKFTRGKDLSRYTENDLACILGTNKIKKSKTEEKPEEKTDNHFVTSFGVTTINSGSIQDYFKKKWTSAKVQSKSVPDVEKEMEEYSCDERPSFSNLFEGSLNSESKEFSKKQKTEDGALDGSEMNGDSGEKHEKRKKRKKKDVEMSEEEEPKSKRKKTSNQDNPADEELQNTLPVVASNETENLLGNENDSSGKRKKEKRKSKENEEDADEEANMEVKKKKKKDRKEKPVEDGYCDSEELASIGCCLKENPEGEGEVVKKKKRETRNEVSGESEKENIEEPSLGVSRGEVSHVVEGEVMVAKGKKKKEKCRDGGNGVDEVIGKNEDSEKGNDDTVGVGSKKKKKKEKQDDKMECYSNQNGISSEILVEKYNGERNCSSIVELEEINKKKKKKEDKMECSSNENGISSEIAMENSNSATELEVKKKKKKKEKQEDKMDCQSKENGISSEASVEKDDNGSNSNSVTELEQVKKKRKKKEKQEGDKMECSSDEKRISSEVPLEKCDDGNNSNSGTELEVKKKRKKKEKEEEKIECQDNKNGPYSHEECENNSSNTVESEEVKKKKKKKEKQDKVECYTNENRLSNEIPVEKDDNGSNSNSITELEQVKKKKRKNKEKQDKMECSSNENALSKEVPVEECHGESNSNSTADLEKVKKKKKKREKHEEDKMECYSNENGISSELPVEKGENGSSSNSTAELEDVKKKRKKKEKQEDVMECHGKESGPSNHEKCDGENNNNTVELEEVKKKKKKEKQVVSHSKECEISSEIPLEKCQTENNPNNTTELESKKKRKKDKHKTKEEDSSSNHIQEPLSIEADQEPVDRPSGTEIETKMKKKKDKKEKQRSKNESSVGHQEQESKESYPDHQSAKAEVGSATERKERKQKEKRKGTKEEGEENEVEANENMWGEGGNAEIGMKAGIDRVEQISQRAAYEHVPGQHRYERVKKMIEWVNLSQFRGSNLEGLDGYGNSVRKYEATAS